MLYKWIHFYIHLLYVCTVFLKALFTEGGGVKIIVRGFLKAAAAEFSLDRFCPTSPLWSKPATAP